VKQAFPHLLQEGSISVWDLTCSSSGVGRVGTTSPICCKVWTGGVLTRFTFLNLSPPDSYHFQVQNNSLQYPTHLVTLDEL